MMKNQSDYQRLKDYQTQLILFINSPEFPKQKPVNNYPIKNQAKIRAAMQEIKDVELFLKHNQK